MLVLNRKQSESIHIGDDIVITVVKLHSNSVRIGIDAPAEIPIRRCELPVISHDDTTARKAA